MISNEYISKDFVLTKNELYAILNKNNFYK